MQKKTASGVLASLRGSPYGLGQTSVHTGDGWAGENNLRFASSLAAALLESLLRILHGCSTSSQTSISVTATEARISFSADC